MIFNPLVITANRNEIKHSRRVCLCPQCVGATGNLLHWNKNISGTRNLLDYSMCIRITGSYFIITRTGE